ncbi:MAG: hypothetical protein ABIH11_03370 [Candidatus Altiarchaeota archaeon]
MSVEKRVVSGGDDLVGGVELRKPLIHIVRPIEEHYWRDLGDRIAVQKPVELTVLDDDPSFRQRFPDELVGLCRELRGEGVRKIHVCYDAAGPHHEFIFQIASVMGFRPHGKGEGRMYVELSRLDRFLERAGK